MSDQSITLYLIDASPYIFRAYHALPSSITSPRGKPTHAVHGYTEFLIQVLKQATPGHIAVAFDGSLTTSFRNEIYPEYKAQRELPPEDLKAQLEACQEVTDAMGMQHFIDNRYEAEDIIATLLRRLLPACQGAVMVSSDKDLAQLVGERVTLWDFARDRRFDRKGVREHFGVWPEQIPDFLALVGDAIDNIPGVPGIGSKTANALLRQFPTVEKLYEHLDDLDGAGLRGVESIKAKLREHREQAEMCKRLATIVPEAPVNGDVQAFEYAGADAGKIDPLFKRLGFDRIRERIPVCRDG